MSSIATIREDLFAMFSHGESVGSASIVKETRDTPCREDQHWLELRENDVPWMNNFCSEDYSHQVLEAEAHGRVLVAGLGLGGDVLILRNKPEVTSIVVVEQSQDIKDLVWPRIRGPRSAIEVGEISVYMATHPLERFDTLWIDIYLERADERSADRSRLGLLMRPILNPGGTVMMWNWFNSETVVVDAVDIPVPPVIIR